MKLFLTIALRNLLQAKRRTVLLTTALALVSLLWVLLLGLSQGVSDTLLRSASVLMSGHVNVGGFFKAKSTEAAPLVTEAQKVRDLVTQKIAGIDYVTSRGRGWSKLVSDVTSIYAAVSGIDIKDESALREHLILAKERDYVKDGRLETFGDVASLAQQNTILLFASQAKRLEVKVGDIITLRTETMSGQSNTTDVRVVAVAVDLGVMSSWTVFVPQSTLRKLYQLNEETTGVLMIYLKEPSRAKPVMEQLRQVLTQAGYTLLAHQPQPFWQKFETLTNEDWLGQRLDLTTWNDELGMMDWMIGALDSVTFFLIAIMLFIIVIGISNSMYMAVRDRTQEIGTVRAIGMQRRQVLWMLLIEGTLLGAGGTALGACAAFGLAELISALDVPITIEAVRMILMSDTLEIAVKARHLLYALGVFTMVTVLACLWPARRAAALEPVTAIARSE